MVPLHIRVLLWFWGTWFLMRMIDSAMAFPPDHALNAGAALVMAIACLARHFEARA